MEQDSSEIELHPLDFNEKKKSYYINCKKDFDYYHIFPTEQIIKCLNFAFSMTFGKEGEQRAYRSGGKKKRELFEIFKNTFHGKLAEFGFYNSYTEKYHDIDITEPDLHCWKLGRWDLTDFQIKYNNQIFNIAIKSTNSYSNLLLLETKDWTNDGIYVPNSIEFDRIVLVRINSYLNYDYLIKWNKGGFILNPHFLEVIESGVCQYINYDIAGFITIKDLRKIIAKEQIIKQDYKLNGKTKIDADNYYIQAGNLREWTPGPKIYG